jgi:hypothetical protein
MAALLNLRDAFKPFADSWEQGYSDSRRATLVKEFTDVQILIKKGDVIKACGAYKLNHLNTAVSKAQKQLCSMVVKPAVMNDALANVTTKVKALYKTLPIAIHNGRKTEHKSAANVSGSSPSGTPPKPIEARIIGVGASLGKGPSRTPTPPLPASPPLAEAIEKERGGSQSSSPDEAGNKEESAITGNKEESAINGYSIVFVSGLSKPPKSRIYYIEAQMDNVRATFARAMGELPSMNPLERRSAINDMINTLHDLGAMSKANLPKFMSSNPNSQPATVQG